MEPEEILLFYLGYMRIAYRNLEKTYQDPYSISFKPSLEKATVSLIDNGRRVVKFWEAFLAKGGNPSKAALLFYKEIKDKLKTGYTFQRLHAR